MDTKLFYQLLNQHCKSAGKNCCSQCWFKEICISSPRAVTDEMVENAEKKLADQNAPVPGLKMLKRKERIRVMLFQFLLSTVVSSIICVLLERCSG